MSIKNPLIPTGIEPATFRFVAQHLNHCATSWDSGIRPKTCSKYVMCEAVEWICVAQCCKKALGSFEEGIIVA